MWTLYKPLKNSSSLTEIVYSRYAQAWLHISVAYYAFVSGVITISYGQYGFRSVLRMACCRAPVWGVNKNKENSIQERELKNNSISCLLGCNSGGMVERRLPKDESLWAYSVLARACKNKLNLQLSFKIEDSPWCWCAASGSPLLIYSVWALCYS